METLKKPLKNKAFLKNAAALKLEKLESAALHPLAVHLQKFLATHLKSNQSLLLALSGGLDSCVLLHALNALKLASSSFDLHVMHVHHGLSANADQWSSFCSELCQKNNIPLQIEHVHVDKNAGMGIEAAARQQRYEALFAYKIDSNTPDFIVTAHHQDDQAETLLLQLFRGAGVKGLSAMASLDQSKRLLRPLLDIPRAVLHEYALKYQLKWCEDESNHDTHYERNFVRHDVLPMLATRTPAIGSVLARTATHFAEAQELLNTLASIDAQPLLKDNSLCLQGLATLDIARVKNVLRWWFSHNQLAMPSADQLGEIVNQLFNAKPDANLCIVLQHLTLRRYQQRAYLCQERSNHPFDLVWQGEPILPLPDGGHLEFRRVTGAGLAVKLGMSKLRISNRDGGERFKPNALRPTRTLKHLLQEANVPPWQRVHLPLIYWQDTLACVPGIGVAYELQASGSEQGIEIVWKNGLN